MTSAGGLSRLKKLIFSQFFLPYKRQIKLKKIISDYVYKDKFLSRLKPLFKPTQATF